MNTIANDFGTVGTIGTVSPYKAPSPRVYSSGTGEIIPTVPTVPDSPESLLALCDSLGVRVWADGGSLRYRGDRADATPELIDGLKRNKVALLDLLAPETQPDLKVPSAGTGIGGPAIIAPKRRPEHCREFTPGEAIVQVARMMGANLRSEGARVVIDDPGGALSADDVLAIEQERQSVMEALNVESVIEGYNRRIGATA